jgi:hypothetical protein
MSLLPATLAAALAGREVRYTLLVRFDFTTETKRVFLGFGTLEAGGYQWAGIGELVSVDGLSSRADTAAEPMTFNLSGISADLLAKARESADEVKGNPCSTYLQFFDSDWQALDDPLPLRGGIMDTLRYDATGPDQRALTLSAEGIFASRRSPPFGRYTDRDQNARFPGDRGLEFIPSLINKTVTWPDF